MSNYTTIDLTRDKALTIIHSELFQVMQKIHKMDNEQLANTLFALTSTNEDSKFYHNNFIVK
jgi:hypothetical protein